MGKNTVRYIITSTYLRLGVLSVVTTLLLFSIAFGLLKQPQKQTQEINTNVTTTRTTVATTQTDSFSFYVISDMRKYTGEGVYDKDKYFKGALEAMKKIGKSEFTIAIGDIDPVTKVNWSIKKYLGISYPWYPVVGNHELPGQGDEAFKGENMQQIRNAILDHVNPGPKPCENTTYSFDRGSVHIVVLNEYCDTKSDIATDGNITDLLYNWLEKDLGKTNKPNKIVIGHEPAFPQPDMETKRVRHGTDSLNQYPATRDRFWKLLSDMRVDNYLCGHTHNFSIFSYKGVRQIDTGHARGIGDPDTKSTFLRVTVTGEKLHFQVYQADMKGLNYTLVTEF